MSDAAVNGKKRAQTIDANCLAHGRGKFKEIEEIFPVECGRVMESNRRVYWYDDKNEISEVSPQYLQFSSVTFLAEATRTEKPIDAEQDCFI